jgi:hypothetical protein
MSLIELIVAIAVSAVVVATTLAAWTALQKHISSQNRRAALDYEARRLVVMLADQARKSPRVLHWHENGITLIAATNGDTLSWEYSWQELSRNGEPFQLREGLKVVDFFLETDNGDYLAPDAPMVVRFNVRLENGRGESTAAQSAAAIRKPPDTWESSGNDDYWNF